MALPARTDVPHLRTDREPSTHSTGTAPQDGRAPTCPTRALRWLATVVLSVPMLTACDKLGLPGMGGPSAADVRREAEGRAIGGACRHAGRAIEDCFSLNRQADKAAIFAGWREMNDYMADKNVAPVPTAAGAGAADGKGGAVAPTGR